MTERRKQIGPLAAAVLATLWSAACSSSSPAPGQTGSGGSPAAGGATGAAGAGGAGCPGASASVTCTPNLAWYVIGGGADAGAATALLPDPTSGAICTSGVAAQGPTAPAAGLAADLNASGNSGATKGIWDASSYGGVAFDFSGTMIPVHGIRVSFVFAGQGPDGPPSYQGTAQPYSTLSDGTHAIIHWDAVGGPYGASNPVLFDPSKLQSMQVWVLSSPSASTPYQFCVANLTALPD